MSDASDGLSVLTLAELPRTEHAHEFVGAEHGGVPFSIIFVHAAPTAGPRPHRHRYAEVFVVESGQATFKLGDQRMVVAGGQIVVGPPGVPHNFTNTGTGELRLIAIHGAARLATEWSGCPQWISRARENAWDRATR